MIIYHWVHSYIDVGKKTLTKKGFNKKKLTTHQKIYSDSELQGALILLEKVLR